jgi:hypothetical protein
VTHWPCDSLEVLTLLGEVWDNQIAFEMRQNWWGENSWTPRVLCLQESLQVALLRMLFIA